MTTQNKDQLMIHNALAAIVFFVGVVIYITWLNKAVVVGHSSHVMELIFANIVYAVMLIISIVINFVFMATNFSKYILRKARGEHLSRISKRKSQISYKTMLHKLFAFTVYFVPVFIILNTLINIKSGSLFSTEVNTYIKLFVSAMYSITMSHLLPTSLTNVLYLKDKKDEPIPQEANTVILGTSGEDPRKYSEYGSGVKQIIMGLKGLAGNLLVLGSIRSGKTQLLKRVLKDLYTRFDSFIPGLILEAKGSFAREARQIITEAGYEDNIIYISLDGKHALNLIYRENVLKDSQLDEVTGFIKAAITNVIGDSQKEAMWKELGANLVKASLAYLGATKNYYTLLDLKDVYQNVHEPEYAEELKRLSEDSLRFDNEERHNIAEGYKSLLSYSLRSDKQRTSITMVLDSFFDKLSDYRAAKVFCPPQNQITLPTMDDLLDSDKVIIFDVDVNELARVMGTMLKLVFQRSVLDIAKNTARGKFARSRKRKYLLLADEAHCVVTGSSGSSSLADEKYLSMAGEMGGITIYATQSITSIDNSMGSERETNDMLNHFRSAVVFNTNDARTKRWLKDAGGYIEVERDSYSLSEVAPNAKRSLEGEYDSDNVNLSESYSTSKVKESLSDSVDTSRLVTFEFLGFIFDGLYARFTVGNTKPDFMPREILQEKVIKQMEKTT